jgi:RNA polymerase sigma factor (TIGR02999 family)
MAKRDMPEFTRLLSQINEGDRKAAEVLLPLVYDELRRLAAAQLAEERPGQTLQATALVHEAYLRLLGPQPNEGPPMSPGRVSPGQWDGRGHFFAAAATAMRRILIENARRKKRLKHGGQHQRVELTDVPANDLSADDHDDKLLALDEALTRLASEDPQAAQVVELHHFAGLSHDLVAATLGITVYLARRKWTYARAYLQHALDESSA